MAEKESCPKCHNPFTYMLEYDYSSQWRYDGISELVCTPCGIRVGRWTGKTLKEGEVEYPLGTESPFVPLPCGCGKKRHPKYPTCYSCYEKSND